MTRTPGIDISRYQIVNDWSALASAVKFIVLRGTVGNYYTDTSFENFWLHAGEQNLLRSVYHVVAPADGAGNKITAASQMNRFFAAMDGKSTDFPVVLDCELSRGQTKDYITAIIAECVRLATAHFGNPPIIYTRQSWFDYWVNPNPLWATCKLWAARYSSYLSSPWSDGYYKFRDWNDWLFWQWTESGGVHGIAGDVDLDWFNGSEDDLLSYCGRRTLADRVTILEREAALHGWNLEP